MSTEPGISRLFRRRPDRAVDDRPVEDADPTDRRGSVSWAAKLETFTTMPAAPEANLAAQAASAANGRFAPPAPPALPTAAPAPLPTAAPAPATQATPAHAAVTASPVTQALESLMMVDGAVSAALVDSNSGMILGQAGSDPDLEIAAASNTQVVRATLATVKSLRLPDTIDDLLFTLTTQFHIIRPLAKNPTSGISPRCSRISRISAPCSPNMFGPRPMQA